MEAFREASLKGWEYAFQHIGETVDLILQKYNSQNKTKDELIFEANTLKKLAYTGLNDLGYIDKNKIQEIYDISEVMGLTKNSIDVNEFVYNQSTKMYMLTQDEKEYLDNKKVITMCIDPNWMPFEKFDNNGKHIGMTADYFKLLNKSIATDIRVIKTKNWEESIEFAQNRKCDILSLVMKTPQREKYFNFTKPYFTMPLVLATKPDVPFLDDYPLLKDKKIAMTKGYGYIGILRAKYPYLNIVEVDNTDEGLKKVQNNEVFGYMGSLASIGYKFQTEFIGQLKISAKFDEKWNLGIGVRNDDEVLLNIFQKAMASIDETQRQRILNNWVSIKYEKGNDYTLFWYLLLALFIIYIFFLYRQYLLNKKNKDLKLLASTDSLTKLYNRRYFFELASNIFQLAKREKEALTVIMLDIDHFKNINDTYGHKSGDKVLIYLSSILLDNTRKSDIVSRWGGEEFVILLPNTNINGAKVIAEKIREAVENSTIKTDNQKEFKVTISLGISEVNNENDIDIEDSINRADKVLYQAKNSGRNRVCISQYRKKW